MTAVGARIVGDRGVDRAQPSPETVIPPRWAWDLGAAGSHLLVTRVIAGAEAMSALDLQQAVCTAYREIAVELRARHAIRLWNFIPGIHDSMGRHEDGLLDRYMVFNAGRYAAYAAWYGRSDVGPQSATATGIGHSGPDLHVHCLAAVEPGEPVENPRQVPAYRYSKVRGPIPPCFARATRVEVGGKRVLLVGGTASVRGEESVSLGDLRGQAMETFHNMACLVGGSNRNGVAPSERELKAALSRYRTLRVYCVRTMDLEVMRELVARYFTKVEAPEYWRADVCRRTLLVEIEGTAEEGGA